MEAAGPTGPSQVGTQGDRRECGVAVLRHGRLTTIPRIRVPSASSGRPHQLDPEILLGGKKALALAPRCSGAAAPDRASARRRSLSGRGLAPVVLREDGRYPAVWHGSSGVTRVVALFLSWVRVTRLKQPSIGCGEPGWPAPPDTRRPGNSGVQRAWRGQDGWPTRPQTSDAFCPRAFQVESCTFCVGHHATNKQHTRTIVS